MDIHRKEPPEPVSKGSRTSVDPPEPVSKYHSPSRDSPKPISKDHPPSTEAPETVHKHSSKGTIPSASTSTSSRAQIQTSCPNTRSHIHQANTPRESIPKTKRERGSAVKGKEPESENGGMEDEAGLSEEGEEQGEGRESTPYNMRKKRSGQ
ncbi:MAG: hypothetical protein Q9215_003031 [Flavoplaca cf. flavocitrina]